MLGKKIVLLAFLCTVAAAKRQARGSLVFLDKPNVLRQGPGTNVASGTAAEPGQSLDHHLGKQLTSDDAPADREQDTRPSPMLFSAENLSPEPQPPFHSEDSINDSPQKPSLDVPEPSFVPLDPSSDPLKFYAAGRTLHSYAVTENTEPPFLAAELLSTSYSPLDVDDNSISNRPFAEISDYSNQPASPSQTNLIQERPAEDSTDVDRPFTSPQPFSGTPENSDNPNSPPGSPPNDLPFNAGYSQTMQPLSELRPVEVVNEVLSLLNTSDLVVLPNTSQYGESATSLGTYSTSSLSTPKKSKFTTSKRPVTSRRTTTKPTTTKRTTKPSTTKKTKPTTIKTTRTTRSTRTTTVRPRTTKPHTTVSSTKMTPKVPIFSPVITRQPGVTAQKVNKTTTPTGPCAQPVPWPLKGKGNPPIVSQNCDKYPDIYQNEMDTCTKEKGFTDTNTKLYIPFCCRKWKKLGCFDRSLNK